jgi:hypothetical protein
MKELSRTGTAGEKAKEAGSRGLYPEPGISMAQRHALN